MTLIYHLTSRNASLAARLAGEYRTESLSVDGFIHFSQRHQILGVANAFYAGRTDLVLLVVEPARLRAELRYEPPAHPGGPTSAPLPAAGDLFPHLYGPLNFEAVLAEMDFPPLPGGGFALPGNLP